jgi:hypothetical protein
VGMARNVELFRSLYLLIFTLDQATTQRWSSIVLIYRVIQEESAVLWEMIVCVILSKKVHINMCPILDGYRVTAIF